MPEEREEMVEGASVNDGGKHRNVSAAEVSRRCPPSCNRPWWPIGLWDVEVATFSTQQHHRWRWGQPSYIRVVSLSEYLPVNYTAKENYVFRSGNRNVTAESIQGYQQRWRNHLKIKERKSLLTLAFRYRWSTRILGRPKRRRRDQGHPAIHRTGLNVTQQSS
jgi:hypothetical protein